MNLLLDTHILLWAVSGDAQLSRKARVYLLDEDNAIFFSAATIWEIGIKHAKHPEIMGISSAEARELFLELGYQELPIRADHGIAAESLPFLHNDPFDRILIAQAKTEALRLLSHDRMLAQYGDPVLAV